MQKQDNLHEYATCIKAKIAQNEILSAEEADILIDADLDAYIEYEHVARIAEATGCTLGEIKAEIAAAPSPYITIQK